MSDPHQPCGPDSADDLLACDFALDLLQGPDLTWVNERISTDGDFAALVAGWRMR